MSDDRNPDLVAVSAGLNELARQIHAKKLATNDPATFRALNESLIDINHRIATVGGLIFTQRSDDIAAAAEKVNEAQPAISRAIAEIDRINNIFTSVSQFLALVDNVVSLARQVSFA